MAIFTLVLPTVGTSSSVANAYDLAMTAESYSSMSTPESNHSRNLEALRAYVLGIMAVTCL